MPRLRGPGRGPAPAALAPALLSLRPGAAALLRGHGAAFRPEVLDEDQEPVRFVDTAVCFEAAPAVLLTAVELFLARGVQPTSFFLGVYEVPRYEGDEPEHPLEVHVLPPLRRWPSGGVGRLLLERPLVASGGPGPQTLALDPPVLISGRPVCCGLHFVRPALPLAMEVISGRQLTRYRPSWDPWPDVLWAATGEPGLGVCDAVEVQEFHTPRAMSWAVHFESAQQLAAGSRAETGEGPEALPRCEGAGPQPRRPPPPLLPGRPMQEASGLEAGPTWPVASPERAAAWRAACELAATDDVEFATFRQATKRGEIGIISDPLAEDGPLTAECMLREILEDERSAAAEGIGELLWRTAPGEGSLLASVGSPMTVEIGGRRLPRDLLWPLIMLKWLAGRFGSLRGLDVLEVGAGFGGLACLVLRTFAVRSYSIVDLPEAQLLQRRFLDSVGPRARFAGKVSFVGAGLPRNSRLLESYDLLVSVCAFSELGADMQERYFEELILRSTRGLLVDNRYTAAASSGRRLDMGLSGLSLMDRLLARGFRVEARTWHAMLPSCDSCSALNLVIFYERTRGPPCHTTTPEFWKRA